MIEVVRVNGRAVRLGITAPEEIPIVREELLPVQKAPPAPPSSGEAA